MSSSNFAMDRRVFEENKRSFRGSLGRCPPSHVAVARLTMRLSTVQRAAEDWGVRGVRWNILVASLSAVLALVMALTICEAVVAGLAYLDNQVLQRTQMSFNHRAYGGH